jgi:transposase
MAFIVRQKVGNHVYLYEAVSYRNREGKPRSKRVPIGKLDEAGQPVYKNEYIRRMAEAGTPLPAQKHTAYARVDIAASQVKEFGSFYLLTETASAIGLLGILQGVFPGTWRELFDLACFILSNGEPFMYCQDWLSKTDAFPAVLTSGDITRLLCSLDHTKQEEFFSRWAAYRSEKEYLALDITSVSSYSELIDEVAWGYNRDGEKLPQVNLCMLLGEQSRLPVYQSLYNGSIKDVNTLASTLSLAFRIQGRRLTLVMDKGFFSKNNVKNLLSGPLKSRFLLSLPWTLSFAREQVEREREGMDKPEHVIVFGKEVLRGVSRRLDWPGKEGEKACPVYVHIYYNLTLADERKNSLYGYVAGLVELANRDPADKRHEGEFGKYLRIKKPVANGKAAVSIREDVLRKELWHAGWMVLISNHVKDAKEALRIYRAKDVIEKGFLRLKNNLDLNRLRVHSDTTMRAKVFVDFIALILLSHIHNVMLKAGLYKNMTKHELIRHMEKLRVQYIKGDRILFPVSKIQKTILDAFGVKYPL